MRRPSIAQSPSGVNSFCEKARRSSFTRALCRPSMWRRRLLCSELFLTIRPLYPLLARLAGCGHVILSFDISAPYAQGAPVRAEIVKISPENPETSLIRYAADQIRAGEVLGMPTDTFYGL